MWALGLRYFNPLGKTIHASLHLFDAVVIVTTFVLEIVLRGKERELASLLIVLRLWRLVKLVGGACFSHTIVLPDCVNGVLRLAGIAIGAGDLEEENAKALMETQQELEDTTKALTEARDEIQHLRARVTWLESEGTS